MGLKGRSKQIHRGLIVCSSGVKALRVKIISIAPSRRKLARRKLEPVFSQYSRKQGPSPGPFSFRRHSFSFTFSLFCNLLVAVTFFTPEKFFGLPSSLRPSVSRASAL
jgi:hypothetical protein